MYLISLKIQEGINKGRVIRCVKFNESGLNIIIDETQDGKGNNVGKTTFLRIIDLCLGATDKKYIWADADTNSENKNLKDYITLNKVFAELIITDNAKNYTLKRELFPGGTQYINGEKENANNYREKLNEIFFQHKDPPSFRQLIGKFVRIKQTDDSYGTLKYLHATTTHAQYTNIYEFLFKLSNPEISAKKLEYTKVIKEQDALRNNLLNAHSIENLDELSERIRLIANEVPILEKNIDKYISLSQYKNDINKISKIKNKINKMNDLIENLNFKKNKVRDILDTERSPNQSIDRTLLKDFFNDVTQNIENIEVQFEELIKFNEQIRKNRMSYYSEEIDRLKFEISDIIENRNRLIDDNSDILNLLNDDNFEKFKSIHEKLLYNKETLGELNEIKSAYKKVSNTLIEYEDLLESLNAESVHENNLEKFNDFFSKLSEKVLGQRMLLISSDGFPLKISNIDDGVGTGHRKTITLLLDISYVYLIKKLNINHPHFFVHDVLESIDEHNMEMIVDAIENVKAQFIFAILKEKIVNYNFITEEDIVLKLSEDNKLFRI